jgi:competence protein ComEC
MVRLTARVPRASVPVPMAGWMVFAYYAVLGGLTWWLAQPREQRRELWDRLKKPGFFRKTRFLDTVETKVLAGVAGILLVLGFFAWRSLPDGHLHVVFLDVGQGDAIFIQTPSGRQVLIDGGPSESVLLSQLGRQMPFWDRTLDVVLLTHPDSDHITGLVGVLERYQVETVIHRPVELESEVYDFWLQLLEGEGATIYRGGAGLQMTLDQGVEMLVLHPGAELPRGTESDVNNSSIVTRLTYGQVSVLLTGDIEAPVERQLVAQESPIASTVLKAAHHGSCSSTTPEFLAAVDPEVAIISVGGDNDFGHPCDGVLEELEARGLPVYRTDERGTVEVTTDGTQVWTEMER